VEQLRATDEWWQENCTAGPDLFIDEFERVVDLLRELPGFGPRFRQAAIPGEKHEDSFDACWNCGASRTHDRRTPG